MDPRMRGEDPASFMGFFRRNDQATIQIMAKAATIVPKACDILGISLSDSESDAEEENDDTAAGRGERSPQPQQSHRHHHRRDHHEDHQQEEEDEPEPEDSSLARIEGEGAGGGDENNSTTTNNVDNHQVQEQEARPKPHFRARLLTPTRDISGLDATALLGSHVRKSRKRCASTPSPSTLIMGQSTSLNSEGLRALNPPTNKKRRFPSISFSSGLGPEPSNIQATGSSGGSGDFSPGLGGADANNNNPTWGNLSPEDYAIRAKMMQDMELLQEQLALLAKLEEEQYALMQRYMQVKLHQVDMIQPIEESSATNNNSDDGTNVSTTAASITITSTTTTTTDQEEGLGMEEASTDDEDVNIINDAEIFTDAEIPLAEEVVVDADDVEMDQEIGSLM